MFTIKRYAYCRVINIYEVEIDDKSVKEFNDWVKSRLPEGDTFVDIEIHDMMELFNGNEEHPRAEEIVRETDFGDRIFERDLLDVVQDYINETIWDSYSDCYDSETNGWKDEITEM